MPILDTDHGDDYTHYNIEVRVKNEGLGLVEQEAAAERRARAYLLVKRRFITDPDVELVDIKKLRDINFAFRSDFLVTFRVEND